MMVYDSGVHFLPVNSVIMSPEGVAPVDGV